MPEAFLMTYRGQIKNGVVVLEGNPPLAEGTAARVELDDSDKEPTLGQKLMKFAGKAQGLPTDVARNHDHYLRGRPKK
jgi:hypothetical protein